MVGEICRDFCKKYCRGCEVPFSPLFHSCILPDCEKVKIYASIAVRIIYESGIIYKEFKKIIDEKKFSCYDSDITRILLYRITYSEVKHLIIEEYF